LMYFEKLKKAEQKSAEYFGEWERTLTEMSQEKRKAELEVQIAELSASERIKQIQDEVALPTSSPLANQVAQTEIEQLKKTCDQLQTKNDDLTKLVGESGKLAAASREKTKEVEGTLRQTEQQMATFQETISALKAQLASSQTQKSQSYEFEQQLASSRNALKQLEDANRQLQEDAKKQATQLAEENLKLKQELTQKEKELRSTIETLKHELAVEKDRNQKQQNENTKEKEKVLSESNLQIAAMKAEFEKHQSESNLQISSFQETKSKIDVLQQENDKYKAFSEELKTRLDKSMKMESIHQNVVVERDNYKSDMDRVASALAYFEFQFPALTELFQQELITRSSPYLQLDHNAVTHKIDVLQNFLKTYRDSTIAIKDFVSGSVVCIQKNHTTGHYEILKDPSIKVTYLLDPDCFDHWRAIMDKNEVAFGSIVFLNPVTPMATADNQYNLPKGALFSYVYLNRLD